MAVVPNGTAPALNLPYLSGQYTEYPAAVQGWAQQLCRDVEATITRIDELKDIRKLNPESFTKEMKKELQECENRLHNYQRSQEMNNTLNEAGIEDSIENNQMIVENLLDAAKEVTDGNTEIISYIEGVNGKVQVVSRWKILPDGTPYLATVILKPMK